MWYPNFTFEICDEMMDYATYCQLGIHCNGIKFDICFFENFFGTSVCGLGDSEGKIWFLQESVRLLVLWLLPSLILKSAREVVRILYVHQESWWNSAIVLFGFVFSSTYVSVIFLSSCILFYLVCSLQVIHFEDYGKLLERQPDALVLIQEHIRLRHYLSKISHRFRIYIILVFLIVTISQFMTLFQTTGYRGIITFINGGDFAVSSEDFFFECVCIHICIYACES